MDGWCVRGWLAGWSVERWMLAVQRAPRADAGQDPNFELEHKSFSSSNVYLIIYCNIAFSSAAVFRNITFEV
jgi:hypothetical protein